MTLACGTASCVPARASARSIEALRLGRTTSLHAIRGRAPSASTGSILVIRSYFGICVLQSLRLFSPLQLGKIEDHTHTGELLLDAGAHLFITAILYGS